MIPRYSVYRGPGNRLVAISVEPVENAWFVKTGELGKRLRSVTVPINKHSSFESVKGEYVSDGYELLYVSKIDHFGYSTDADASVIHWEGRSVDVESGRQLLRKLESELSTFGVDTAFVDDMSGTTVTMGQIKFGFTRVVVPGCIDFDGNGAGTLAPSNATDLLCLVAMLSESLSISLVDAEGSTLSRGQVFHRFGAKASDSMSSLLETRGYGLLTTSLRKLGGRQVRF